MRRERKSKKVEKSFRTALNPLKNLTALLLLIGIAMVGCKKELPPALEKNQKSLNETITDELSVTDGILTFSSQEAYEIFIANFISEEDGMDESVFEESMDYLQTLDYISLYAYKLQQDSVGQYEIDSLYGSEFLQNILNSDHLVIIGDYIFKINMSTEHVYVLELSDIDHISDLIDENITDGYIQEFSTDDDVFEELNNPTEYPLESLKTQKARCGEDGCAGTGINGMSGVVTTTLTVMRTKAIYLKFGIYFEVSAMAEFYYNVPYFGYPTYIANPVSVNANCTLKRKCKNLVNIQTSKMKSGYSTKIVYSCAIPLSKIHLQVGGYVYINNVPISMPSAEFRRNI